MVAPLLARAAPFLRTAGGRLASWIGKSKKRVAVASGSGAAAGTFGLTTVADALGITTERLDTLIRVGTVLAVIVALGQLFDIQIGE